MSIAENRYKNGLEWPVVIFMALIHLLAIGLCVAFPSIEGLWAFLILYLATGLGITVGYHRKLTHQSFKSSKLFDRFLALLGLLAGEGPPIFWVAHHRKHHRHSDQPEDPHSPKHGFWWGHWLWLFPKHNKVQLGVLYKKWTPDLLKVPFYQALESSYMYWHLAFMLLIFGVGWLIGGWYIGMSFVAYGFFLRSLVVLHATWLVNSAAHTWGYRNYETTDDSRNNWFVVLVSHGEGWHNNHHYTQAAANHGQRWWEADLSFAVIFLLALISWPLKWIGLGKYRLAYNLKFYLFGSKKFVTLFPGK